ncbi:oxygenase MpaB family protein [Nocardioides dongxiaopingii]|uniref:oxygenase MpaB family protein n=1 Tax=Nocardioides dongxiaopingii TaxID=2576036 RepID=UPI0010C77008|nr:oxygenase MpaB family protein [Nocardioides dongxiaopingii]
MINDVRGRLGEALFLRVAGPEGPAQRDRIHGAEGPRWFEPGSPITEVHGDASMFVGGIRALLLQTLHPAAMRAVAEHSGYRGDMWGRLHRTSTFLATTTFGAADDAQRSVDIVRAIHRRVVGTMPDGSAYAASDPHLLRWVHVAEVDSFLRAHTVYGQRVLDQDERDEYVAQAGLVARRLGASDVPATEAELVDALASYRPELRGTPEAREAVRHVLVHPPLPLLARAPYGVLVAAAVGLMPAWTRPQLRLPWLPVTERTVVRGLGSAATGTIRWAMRPPA